MVRLSRSVLVSLLGDNNGELRGESSGEDILAQFRMPASRSWTASLTNSGVSDVAHECTEQRLVTNTDDKLEAGQMKILL